MPNYCNGHYFLTMLAPVRTEGPAARGGGLSHRQRLLEVLARMPNSEVTVSSAGTGGAGAGSPFARCDFVHLARFVLIDGPAFNGRVSGNALLDRLRGIDPMVEQETDRLTTPFLLFAADLDVEDGSEAAFARRIRNLWERMSPELTQVFEHCTGFEEIRSARNFYDYVRRCQVETTMPFNDYWPEDAALPADTPLHEDAILPGLKALAGVAGLWVLCVLLAALLPEGGLRDAAAWASRWGLLAVPLLIGAAAAVLAWTWRRIMALGCRPLPSGASLPRVLKALHLQHRFTDLVTDIQGRPDAELHRAFGEFLRQQRPTDLAGPTQPRGVIPIPARQGGLA